ncbi:hypothetical protein C5748_12920 [Phyllobacterium phragmitis]|uniref:Winged helix-turn-helix domain-containing protein n=1 Tax=Phyllobacterium phragmitis TaxID=2670329 RepID=A0A2S9IRE6_9HYPH|nr:tetratricopeptide repeat protein [Phyllobacterium phragmitis]PRD43104.1 hypothetical protein C5748_12920 [Phyllobacterium phragmitis]
MVAEISRSLEGIALALELAARRTGVLGLDQTAALLDNRLQLQWKGSRTASPRHQTLHAMLDWSYNLISEPEQRVLRRVSVFVGGFSLEAAQAVASDTEIDDVQVIAILELLADKSLVLHQLDDSANRYRLLDTTRTYARNKLVASGEETDTLRRHARFCISFLGRTADASSGELLASYRQARKALLGDVRAALELCFSADGDRDLSLALAAAATALFIELSLVAECRSWAERAIAALESSERGTKCELELQASLGHAMMFCEGNDDRVQTALERGLTIAEKLEDPFAQFRLLSRLHMYFRRTGEFDKLLPIAERAEQISADLRDPIAVSAANVLLGVSYHLLGDQAAAQAHLEACTHYASPAGQVGASHFAFHRSPQIAIARALWLQGHPDAAEAMADGVAKELAPRQDVVTFCIALIWAISVFQWTGNWAAAATHTERLIDEAERHSLAPYRAVGLGIKGETLIAEEKLDGGIKILREALRSLKRERYELYTSGFRCTLAQALASRKHFDQALSIIDDAIGKVAAHGTAFNLPELIRVRGDVLIMAGDWAEGEKCLEQSLALADRQASLSWRLRTATSLARLRSYQGRNEEARQTLSQVYDLFMEGFDTADLQVAKRLLVELS